MLSNRLNSRAALQCNFSNPNASSILPYLRAELQKAVEEEQYETAADIRKQMAQLEADTLAASAAALAMRNVKYEFRLGQKLTHKKFGAWRH